ncbi:hypothetical protein Tco_0483390, partial [Tanacetum coccineum]
STPMETQKLLLKDEDGEEVDVHLYRSMIGSLMYLTSSRPDIMFAVCACARYQVNPKVSHLHAVAYTDSDYARASLDRKSTTGEIPMKKKLIQMIKIHTDKNVADLLTKEFDKGWQLHNRFILCTRAKHPSPLITKKIFANMRRPRKNLSLKGKSPLFPNMVVQAQEEMGEGSAMPTDPHHTPIITQPSSLQPQRKQKSRRPKEKDTQAPQSYVLSNLTNIADEAVTEEPSLQLKELMDFFSSDEASLGDQEDASKQERKIDDIDADAEITLDMDEKEVSTTDPVTTASEVVTTSNVEISNASPTAAKITNVELTLAQTLTELKSARLKTKGVVMQEASESTPTISLQLPSQVKGQGSKDNGKAKMIEPEKPLKKKDHIKFDEKLAFKLQAKEDEEERLAM